MSDLISRSDLIRDIYSKPYIGSALAEIFETIVDEQPTACDKEIRDMAIDEFAKKMKNNLQLYPIDAVFETSSFADYSGCVDIFWEYIDEIAKQMNVSKGKKPITYNDTDRDDCPVCGATVRGLSKPFGDYCSKCGQKLDWSEEDER